jgi:hypothetical protein
MAEQRKRSRYAQKIAKRKQLSGSRGTTTIKGKRLPIPLPLFQDSDVED